MYLIPAIPVLSYRPGPAVQRQNTVDENPANPLGRGVDQAARGRARPADRGVGRGYLGE